MANAVVSYDHLALQVEVLRKENSHLRRELEDNSHHLCKLETETFGMKEMLKQLQSKLEQEAGNLASSGRTDVLHQLKELYMDLTNYYELKHQPHNLRLLASGLGGAGMRGGAGPALSGSLDLEDHLALPSSSCCSSSSSMAAVNRARSPLRAASRQGMVSGGETAIMLPNHFLDGAPPQTAVICEGDGRLGDHHFEELYKERNFLLGEIDREERERLEVLSHTCHRLAQLPRIDEISFQLDLIRQNLEDKVHRSLMAERYLASNEMVHRTQMRAARLEQLEKELHEARGGQESQLPLSGAEKPPAGEPENSGSSSAAAAGAEAADGGSKVEMVFWLLSMLANRDKDEMSRTLLALSSSQDSCIAMRKSGCVPLLVQILHEVPSGVPDGVPGETTGGAASTGCSRDTKSRASAALHNIIFSQQDEGQAHREMKVLHMLEQIRTYCDSGWDWLESHAMTPSPGGTKTSDIPEPVDPQICQAMCAIMKMSFEEEYRRAMNELGCLQVVADLIHLEHEMYGMQNDPINMALRRYAGMGLTNLTFGDVVNKATLCSRKSCLQALVAQLSSDSEELHQVVSSVMRNLSWRADISTKRVLRDISCVSALMTCALQATKESTLKSVLSALWNLSAHNIDNKVAICSVDGSLGFLVSTLTYRCQTNSLAIIESGGGILRNVSSLIATREDYRQILRDHNCLQTLLAHLRSHSLTIVSNACGTLWNLSARSPKDQELLWDLGAVSMLRNLIHSKHKMIAMGSAAALRNLLTNRPLKYKDTAVLSPGSCVPSLYMRKQKAFEAELNAKHLAETFDTLEKQSSKHLSFNKPLRHIESLAKDYASDSGCFDDDEAPNNSNSLDTGSFSVLPMYLTNSNFVQNQPHRRDNEPERDTDLPQRVEKKHAPPDDVVSAAAEKLAKKITNTVAKIDRLVDDITMHTSSEDSFSLSSEDHLADWPYGQDELNEARANSCSPCCLSDVSSLAYRERLSRAHALLRLKTAHTSVSTDSLNSGSTSDGYCGSKDQVGLVPKAQAIQQQRPNQLDLKVAHQEHLNVGQSVLNQTNQQDIPERDSVDNKVMDNVELGNTDIDKNQEQPIQTPVSVSTKISSDVSMTSIKLSPSYQQVPLIQSVAKFGVAKTAINVQAAQAMRRQAWVPTVLTGGSITKFAPMNSTRSPTVGTMETVQKYSVENTPICFSRCSSLSSLSSGDGGLDGQSENELESDSSLEIIEMDDGEEVKKEQEDETLEDLSDSQLLMTDSKTLPIKEKDPIEISRTPKKEKVFLRGASPAINEDRSPSSSSENYIHDTPLVLSRCSSVSSLGSFESPSIASSIQSDPCSEMIDGTISPSDLPDSPGQTMPPSRSKTPCCVESNVPETQTTGMPGQWENSLRKFIEITDSKERFNLPDLETMIYFTVEKPTENFSCASSLSALPLHEHYIQKDVELKLTPLLQQNDENLPYPDEDEEGFDNGERYSEGNSEEDIEILKECINSAMPSKFRKVRSSLVTAIPSNVLNSQIRKPIQLQFNMLPNGKTQICPRRRNIYPQKDLKLDDSSFTDSAEGTPINFSSTTSLSDETLQYPLKNRGAKDCTAKGLSKQEVMDNDAKRIEDLRIFSHFHKPHGATYPPEIQMSRTTKHVIPTQKLLMQSKEVADRVAGLKNRERSPNQQRRQQGQGSYRKFDLPVIKQNKEINVNSRTQKENKMFRQMTHSSEDSIDFYGDNNEEVIKRTSRKQMKEAARSTLSRSMTNIGRIDNSQGKPRGFLRLKQNLLRDESLACYSLSSSVSSLSDAEFEEHKAKAQQMWYKNRHNKTLNMAQQTKAVTLHCQYEEQSSPSSVSMDSEDDLLQKCITSAMPKQRRKMAARKKKTENTHKHKDSDRWDMDEEMDSDDTGWDNDSDLNSVEWRAIQEGANCVVTGLQASKSQEPSSEETESILSFMSTSSFTPKEKKFAKEKKANKPLDFAQRKPVPNLPVVFRGRTVIYTPQQATAPSQRPPPRKMPTKTDAPKNPNLAQHRSKSLHRLGQPQDVELSLPKRSSTPPPRIPKSSSSGSSQSSTPSKQSQKKTVSPTQTGKPIQKKTTSSSSSSPASSPPERKGRSPVLNKNDKSPPPKTQKSPVRIPFMQNSTRQPRPLSPLVTNQTSPKQINGKRVSPANRFDMVRMTSVHSSSGESDRNGFLRQLTFIKESRTPFRRDGSPHNTPRSQNGSPRRAAPGATAVFLCSSRCQELKVAVQTPKRVQVKDPGKVQQVQKPAPGLQKQTTTLSRATSSERDLSGRRPTRRTSSESPCRVAQRSATGRISGVRHQQEQDTFKRHASSPSINILSRVTSRSSLRSSSSDSSGRAKSEDDTKKKGQRSTSRRNTGVTWRRIRDEDVPQILKSTLPANALPLVPSPDGEKPKLPALPGKLPTVVLASRKTTDATVQTEDLSNDKTNSSTSPAAETAPVISEEEARLALLRKFTAASGSNHQDADSDGSLKSLSTTGTSDSHVGGVVTFRQGSWSNAARVTPFNYIPSPMACCLEDPQSQTATMTEKAGGKIEL